MTMKLTLNPSTHKVPCVPVLQPNGTLRVAAGLEKLLYSIANSVVFLSKKKRFLFLLCTLSKDISPIKVCLKNSKVVVRDFV